MSERPTSPSRYQRLVEKVFFDRYKPGDTAVSFERKDLETASVDLGIELPKNIGDVIYSIRYRTTLPSTITEIQPENMEWVIEGTGRASYEFRLLKVNRIAPNPNLVTVKIPDATPEIVAMHAMSDEQALLAKVRYNRLVDIFLGISTFSLQNHLRTTVAGIGQIEIDELYVGVNRDGSQFIVPVQAKGGNDQLSVVQAKQDIQCCREKFPSLVCRALSAQFMREDLIAMFELDMEDGELRVAQERHYRLVPADEISSSDLERYRERPSR